MYLPQNSTNTSASQLATSHPSTLFPHQPLSSKHSQHPQHLTPPRPSSHHTSCGLCSPSLPHHQKLLTNPSSLHSSTFHARAQARGSSTAPHFGNHHPRSPSLANFVWSPCTTSPRPAPPPRPARHKHFFPSLPLITRGRHCPGSRHAIAPREAGQRGLRDP